MVLNRNIMDTTPIPKENANRGATNTNVGFNINDLNKKSILFEVVNRKDPSNPVESFILTLPPESIEVEEPQRVSRTKTWGGQFVDDYGSDNIRINISGHTGGAHLRKTYALTTSEDFNGKTAFFYFRNHIARYKHNITDHQNYDLIVYDLSAANDDIDLVDLGNVRAANGIDSYVVSLEKFKLSRSKDRPKFYAYNIELEVLRILGEFAGVAEPPVAVPRPIDWMESLRVALNSISSVFDPIDTARNQIDSAIDLFNETTEKVTGYFERAADILVYPMGVIRRFVGAVNTFITTIDNMSDSVLTTLFGTYDDALSTVNLCKQIQSTSRALLVYGKTPEARGLDRVATNDLADNRESVDTMYRGFDETDAEVFQLIVDRYLSNYSSDSVESYGYINVTVTAATTMEGLAAAYYGDPSLWEIIAVLNSLKDDTDLMAGATIKIPVLLQGGTQPYNFIYTGDLIDIYGTDIKIDSQGGLAASSAGDLAVVSGVQNLVQALDTRLSEELGSRLRLTVYGIRAAVGRAKTNAPISYILANVRDTLVQDPRVAYVDNLRLRGRGDQLFISFDIRTIKLNEVIPYTGNI